MKALIFNSGLGKRMGEFTQSNHKSMAVLSNGETIFGRQLRLLAAAGVTEFVITTGPFVDQLKAETQAAHLAGIDFTFVANDVFDSTNYIYSMYLAREHLDDDLLMLHGDLVFNAAALESLLSDQRPDLGMVNDQLPQPEKDFKARVIDGVIREVSVSIADEDCHAFQPLYKLSRRAIGVWLARVVDFVERGDTAVYAENALNEVAELAAIQAFSYAGQSVNEVDTLDDLDRVSAEIRIFDFDEQSVLMAPEAYMRIPELLQSAKVRRPLLVGGQSFDASFIKPFLDASGIDFVRFAAYSANPKLEEVQAGLAVYRAEGCDAIISLGGGSALDVAKCIKILAAANADAFPASGAKLSHRVPHLAIPSTAGTGSESTHFAVVYIDGEKHSIAHDATMPEWVVLEPRLLEHLPDYHKKASLLDALGQCIESSWAASATEQSIDYAMQGITLILDNLFPYFHKAGFDEQAARNILIASNLGGKAINLTKTTAPHAMSYKMTSLYGIAHGHAVALCLVGVWWLFVKFADEGTEDGLAVRPALDRLASAFGADTRRGAIDKLEIILEFLQLASPALDDEAELDELVGSVNQERLGNSPVPLSKAEIRRVYEFVFGLHPAPFPDPLLEREAADADTQPPAREQYESLKALHAYEMDILTAFDAFCTKHELQYYLSEGSILGAVRHGGIIPWDDDVDVMMPREDYRRFVELAQQGALGARYNLDSFETNKKHWVLGAKLQLTEATEFYLPKITKLAHYDGPYIDIFPVDPVAKTSGPRFWLQRMLIRGFRRMLFMSSGHSLRLKNRPFLRVPLYALTRVIPTPIIHKWIVWAQSKFNSTPDAASWANLCSYYPLEREVFPREWFGKGRRVSFEGVSVLMPTEAEGMLRQIYGADYSQVPTGEVKAARLHSFSVDRDMAGRSAVLPHSRLSGTGEAVHQRTEKK